jgi:T-complex protein 1 subunit delta
MRGSLQGMDAYCVRAFAEALEIIPYTLAENAGLNAIEIVTELRNMHATGKKYSGGWPVGVSAGAEWGYL